MIILGHLESEDKQKGFCVVQSLGGVQLFVTPLSAAGQALSFTISQSLLKLMPIELVIASHQPSHLLSPSSPAFYLPQHQDLFQLVSFSHQVVKV